MNDISIIIPIFNEALSLNTLLKCISNQSISPKEIIFVDSGSTDSSIEIITNFINNNHLDYNIYLYNNKNGYPGANRNYGINKSNSEYVVLLDCVLEPEPIWLEELYKSINDKKLSAVFGICIFNSFNTLQKAFCAISHGCGTSRIFLGASIFRRTLFNEIGFFREDIRASEDLLWFKNYEDKLGIKLICRTAIVHYRHYPKNFKDFIAKYFIYEMHTIKSGLVPRNIIVLNFILTIIFIILLSYYTKIFLIILFLQFFIRTLITPIIRCLNYKWWKGSFFSLMLAMPSIIARDFSKYSARIVSFKQLFYK